MLLLLLSSTNHKIGCPGSLAFGDPGVHKLKLGNVILSVASQGEVKDLQLPLLLLSLTKHKIWVPRVPLGTRDETLLNNHVNPHSHFPRLTPLLSIQFVHAPLPVISPISPILFLTSKKSLGQSPSEI